uniref:Odorant-binding protein 6 n=1 Tax=Anopheles quadriannulatus TaxID=34691 RepID=A0A182XM67_ANOQN
MDLKKSVAVVFVSLGWMMRLQLTQTREEMEQCCQVDMIIPLDRADDCSSAVDESSEPHDKMMCPLECKLKSLGLLNGDDLVEAKVQEYVDRLEGDWKGTAKTIATDCITTITEMKKKIQDRDHDMKCSPVGAIFMMCLMKHTQAKCPEDKWQNTSFCNKMRSGECFPKRGRQ